jgi:uncharacterized membrane protein
LTSTPDRRRYLDWLRGVGVLIMIEAHTLDSWTRVADRERLSYKWAIVLGGFGAPIFLFLAGIAMPLAVRARMRRGMTEAEAMSRAWRRAWQIFGLAFLFRLQSLVISGGGWRAFLKVDILNVMGVSMLFAALLWTLGRSTPRRVTLLVAATGAAAMLTPVIRVTPLLDALPEAVESYFRPSPNRSTFVLFPWSGFLLAGVVTGLWLGAAGVSEARRNSALLIAGVAIGAGGYAASFLPALYRETSFWTSSPTFFFLRLGVLLALVPLAFAWTTMTERLARRTASGAWTPIQEFGIASLFVYWIHVEMVYGVLSTPLHRALSFEQALAAMTLFAAFLYLLVKAKKRWIEWRKSGEDTGQIAPKHRSLPVQRPQSS